MAKDVLVRIKGSDDLSDEFKKIGASAKSAGQDIGALGRDFGKLERESRGIGRALRDNEDALKQIGRGVGVLAGGLALAGRSFRDQEIALSTLRRGYGDTADELERFANQIQDTTNFSNDQAVAAANIFRTLADNYGFTAGQIEQLIAISADLAATTGIGLADAAMRVQSAMRGEAEAAEYLGLTLNDRALGLDRLTASTTEAERAQIRFVALQQQSAFAMGAAEAQAGDYYGQLVQLRDQAQDLTQSLGGMLGPIGQVGAFFADNAIQAGLMTLAITQLASAFTALNAVAGGNLLLKTGAVGLGIGALVGGTLAAMEALWPDDERFHKAAISFEDSAQRVQKAIYAVQAVGDQSSADVGQFALDALVAADVAIERMGTLQGQIAMNQRALAQGAGDANPNLQAETDAMIAQYEALVAIYGDATVAQEDYAAGAAALNAILLNQGTGRQQALIELAELNDQFRNGKITASVYIHDLILIGSQLTSYDRLANQAADANAALSQSIKELTPQQQALNTLTAEYNELQREDAAWQRVRAENIADLGEAGRSAQVGAMDAMVRWRETTKAAQQQLLALRTEQFSASFEAARTQFTMLVDALGSGMSAVISTTDAIGQQSQQLADWADSLGTATEHFDQWGNSLGWWSRLDEIVEGTGSTIAAATLSQREYNLAQQAFADIARENVEIQQNLDVIQAKQAPMLAQMTENLENYLQTVAEMPPEQQAFALAMMDSTTATQAFDLAMGLIENRNVFGPMAEQVANLNPYIGETLVKLGLMEKVLDESTGTYTYELVADTSNAQTQIGALTEAIDRLTMAQWLVMFDGDATKAEAAYEHATGLAVDWDGSESTATIDADDSPAQAAIDRANAALTQWTFTRGTGTIDVQDNATDKIYAAIGALNSFDGRVATSYINTYVTTIRSFMGSSLSPLGLADGGTIPHLANGGTVSPYGFSRAAKDGLTATVVGERGPELLFLPGGAQVMNTEGSQARMRGGESGVQIVINVNAPVNGYDEFSERLARDIASAWQRASQVNARSMGR